MNDISSSTVNARELQEILNEALSEKLEQLGLAKSAQYSWHEQSLKEIRRGFSYLHLKGATGTFTWGVNLDFVPVASNGKIVYHKSAKKYLHHLFEWTNEYSNSFIGGRLTGGVATHGSSQETRKSIDSLFKRYEKNIITWFDNAGTVENLINLAEKQVLTGKYYDIHSPNPKYVLAFLLARTNQIDLATKQFDALGNDEFANNQELREKLRALLISLKSNSPR